MPRPYTAVINDFGHWIPAFAGMTVEGRNDGNIKTP